MVRGSLHLMLFQCCDGTWKPLVGWSRGLWKEPCFKNFRKRWKEGWVFHFHLYFADDSLQMWAYLRCVLLCFEAVSKLSVNLDKSELLENSFLKMFIPLKKAIKCPWGLAQVVKGGRGFVGGYRFKSQWGPKIYWSKKNKKKKKGNQVTLIKSTLSKFTIIFMSTFIMPFSVSHIAEKLQQNLLWGNLEKEKPHLVEWKMACLPRGMVAWEWEK